MQAGPPFRPRSAFASFKPSIVGPGLCVVVGPGPIVYMAPGSHHKRAHPHVDNVDRRSVPESKDFGPGQGLDIPGGSGLDAGMAPAEEVAQDPQDPGCRDRMPPVVCLRGRGGVGPSDPDEDRREAQRTGDDLRRRVVHPDPGP